MTYIQYIIADACPAEVLAVDTSLDFDTYRDYENGKLGCRGITCEQCWNTEISKGVKK